MYDLQVDLPTGKSRLHSGCIGENQKPPGVIQGAFSRLDLVEHRGFEPLISAMRGRCPDLDVQNHVLSVPLIAEQRFQFPRGGRVGLPDHSEKRAVNFDFPESLIRNDNFSMVSQTSL